MINYRRSSFYGFNYLLYFRGSVLPRTLPAALLASLLNWAVLKRYIKLWDDDGSGTFISHPYTFQLVGLVFGYLTVYRINISYNRYWEGVTMIKNMHSKWADACGQVICFDRSRSGECNLTSDAFCCHIVRLFSQMSAMATMRLHVVEAGDSVLLDALKAADAAEAQLQPLARATRDQRRSGGSFAPSFRKRSSRIAPDNDEASGSGPGSPASSFTRQKASSISSRNLDVKTRNALGAVATAADRHGVTHSAPKLTRTEKVQELAAGISLSERKLLLAAPCPVFASAQRIQRAIVTRIHAGGMHAPPPIISRIFQEISNGMLAYNNATKLKEIPVPFAYVQLNAVVLNLFAIVLCPVAIASFTPTLWLSITTTAITVMSFFAVFIVANEMEDPFGTEANDMPMLAYHEEFCASLCALMTAPWVAEDQWLVSEGRWVRPRTVGLAANAFCDAIGRKGVRVAPRARPEPFDSVLNRSKLSGSKRSAKRRDWVYTLFTGKPAETAYPKVLQHGEPGVTLDSVQQEMEEMATVIQRATRAHKARLMRGHSAGLCETVMAATAGLPTSTTETSAGEPATQAGSS